MTKRLLLSVSAVLLAALPALAQGGPGGWGGPGGPGPMGFGGERGGFGIYQTVTNAPYTATFTTTATEKLQDGTVLTRNSTRTVERDSLGRTREEVTMPARSGDDSPRTMIVIMDPVARTVTQLRPDQKVAVVHALPQPPQHTSSTTGSPSASTTRPPRPEDKNAVTTELGTKTIDGVVATGKLVTRTIPAGQMGNTTAIVSTHEEWFAPDLKIELSRSDVDPFRGTHTTSVSSLSKAEPAAALFAVPSGYTVQQAPQHAFGRRGQGKPASTTPGV